MQIFLNKKELEKSQCVYVHSSVVKVCFSFGTSIVNGARCIKDRRDVL